MSGGRDTGTCADRMSKEIGGLLLQGWRMIDEACPVTGAAPLMQHPVNKRKFSVAVGKYVDELGSSEAQAAPMALESAEDTPTDAAQIQGTATHAGTTRGASVMAAPVGWAGACDRVEPLATSEPVRCSQRDDDAWCKTLGDLMLQGWTMLAEHCPETGAVPLMQHPKSRRKFSVATGRYVDEALASTANIADEPEPPPCLQSSRGSAPAAVSLEADRSLTTTAAAASAHAFAASAAQTTGTDACIERTTSSSMGTATIPAPAADAATSAAIHRARFAVAGQLNACTNALQRAEVPPPLSLLEAICKCADAIFALDRVSAGEMRCT